MLASEHLPQQFNVAQWFVDRNVAEGRRERPAFHCEGRSLTYGDVHDLVDRTGNTLLELGIGMEDRVLILCLDTPEFIGAFWGAIKIGAIPIPVNTVMRAQDYLYFLDDSRAKAAVISAPLLAEAGSILSRARYLKHVLIAGGAPGPDYAQAAANINGVTGGAVCGVGSAGNGNGDGQILAVAGTSPAENVLAWEHLSRAGFINGTYTCAAAANPTSAPTNPYGQFLDLVFDNGYAVPDGAPAAQNRHILKTGGNIASDLLAEIDRKVDDGNPGQGSYRGQTNGTVNTGALGTCFTLTAVPPVWVTANPGPNCGGVTIY